MPFTNGTLVIPQSTTSGVGIGLNNPQGKLDIQTTSTVGAIKILTTTTNVVGGGTATTPYAFKVQYQHSLFSPATDETVAQLSGSGILNLGSFSGLTPLTESYLNVKSSAAIYNDNNTYLNFKTAGLGSTITWKSAATNGLYKNLNFSYNNGAPIMTMRSEGKVGIGTTTPTTALQIVDNTATNTTGSAVYGLHITNNGWRNEDYALKVSTYNGDYRLYVETGIRTEKIRVDIAADNGWADFVFDDDYELMSTQDLADYIAINKHLPNVPSEKQVREEGIDLAEMNAILLRQIEELTLRVIELEKTKN